MRRRYLLALVALGVVLFVAISIGLARVFGANGTEQSAITSLVKAEAAGDQQAMLARIRGLRPESLVPDPGGRQRGQPQAPRRCHDHPARAVDQLLAWGDGRDRAGGVENRLDASDRAVRPGETLGRRVRRPEGAAARDQRRGSRATARVPRAIDGAGTGAAGAVGRRAPGRCSDADRTAPRGRSMRRRSARAAARDRAGLGVAAGGIPPARAAVRRRLGGRLAGSLPQPSSDPGSDGRRSRSGT